MGLPDGWAALDRLGFQAVTVLLSVLWQSSILLAAAGALALLLRRRRASVRHAVWVAALLMIPALPVLGWLASSASAPQAPIPVMPAYPSPRLPAEAPVRDEAEGGAPPAPVAAPFPAAGPPAPPEPRSFGLLAYPWALALAGYAAGALFFLSLVLIGRLRIGRWARRGRVITSPRVLGIFRAARHEVGAAGGLTVVESAGVGNPMTVGWLHPVVLLPAGFTESLADTDLRAVAIHESAHVRRRDPLLLALLSFVRAALYFHPLVWLACRQVSLLAESACDDTVLEATAAPVSYARLLARLAEELPRRALAIELAAGFVFSKGAFLRRIEAILSDRRDQIRRLPRWALAVTLVAALVSVALAVALPLGERSAAPGSGEATSAASPAGEVELRTNSALKLEYTDNGLAWAWSREAPLLLRVKQRPGYTLGRRFRQSVLISGEKVYEHRYDFLLPQVWDDGDGGVVAVRPPEEVLKRAEAGEPLAVRLDLEVFETSVPPRKYGWTPEGGDYRVLWKGRIEGRLPPARWILTEAYFLDARPGAEKPILDAISMAGAPLPQDKPSVLLSDEQARALLKGASAFPAVSTLAAPPLRTFSNKWGRTAVQTRRTVELPLDRDPAILRETGYHEGVTLDAAGTASEDDRSVWLQIQPRATRLQQENGRYLEDEAQRHVTAHVPQGFWLLAQVPFVRNRLMKVVTSEDPRTGQPVSWLTKEAVGDPAPAQGTLFVLAKPTVLKTTDAAPAAGATVAVGEPSSARQGLAADVASGAGAPPPAASGSSLWVWLLAKSPIRSLAEYHHALRTDPPGAPPLYKPTPVPACDLEIRRAGDQQRVARLPYVGYLRENREFDQSDRRRIGDPLDGGYLLALVVGDVRCSNVAEFEIRSAYDPSKERPLRLMALEPGPGGAPRYLGLRGTGPTPEDPEFDTVAVHCPNLIVDGVERRVKEIVGSFLTVGPGRQAEAIVDLQAYVPPIALDKPHTVKARFRQYESNAVQLPGDGRLARAWDDATPRLAPAPAPPVVLHGQVTGPDGKPGAGYEVWLAADNRNYREKCAADGRYTFVNVPPGRYQLGTTPPARGQPALTAEGVEVQAGQTVTRDLNMEAKFSFSGKVVWEDGAPAAGVEVMATWPSPDGSAEFSDYSTVGADGRYTVRSPYPEASYVGISMTGPHPDPKRGVKDGRTDVDFVMPRLWGNAVEGVQCRVRAEKPTWPQGALPKLFADLRNQGKRNLRIALESESWELEIDGTWHQPNTGFSGLRRYLPLPPGGQQQDLEVWILDVDNLGKRLRALEPGKHALRVARLIPYFRSGEDVLRVVSNPVQIEIVADKPGSDADKTAGPSAEVYRKQVANLVLPQKDDPYLPSQEWLKEHLAGAVPYLLQTRLQYQDQFNRVPAVTDLLFEAWQAGLLDSRQKPALLENTLLIGWEMREAYPPGYAGEALVNFRGVFVSKDMEPHEPGDTWKRPLGPEGFLKAAWRVELDGKEVRRGETGGSDGFLLRLPEGLQPGGHKLEAIVEVSERGGGWSHTWTRSSQVRIDPEIEALPAPIPWGRETGGLRAGLTFDPQDRPYHVGEQVGFRLVVRNLSGKTVELVDFGTMGWMPTVTDSAGKPVMVAGHFDGPVQRRRHTLPDGQTLLVGTVTLMLDKNPEARASQPFHAHLAPGTYRVSQKYRFADDPEATWSGELATGELELEVVPAEPPGEGKQPGQADWGPAVDGVQCHLRAEKPAWPQGIVPTVKVDFRNRGTRNLKLVLGSEYWELQCDGIWYRMLRVNQNGLDQVLLLGPNQQHSDYALPLGDYWRSRDGGAPLVFAPGKHVIRVAFQVHPAQRGDGTPVRVVSNPIEVEITAPPPDAAKDRPQEAVRGRVVDHEGEPVTGATVYLAGSQALEWERIEAWQGKPPSVSGPTAQTGPQGGFALGVAGTPKNRLVIASPSLAVWVVPLPEPGTEPTIRLPVPATLRIRCDIPGADGQAQFHLHLKTWQMEGWKGLTDGRQYVSVPVPNPGQIVLSNLTPGTYDLARKKNVRVGDYGMGLFCNARDVTLDGGQTVEAALVRGAGQPILGQVVGLKGTDVAGAFLFVKTAAATGDPRKERGLHLFDVLTCDVEGQFKTETLPPGDYTVVAEAYGPDMLFSGERLPDYVGAAKATVWAEGPPPQVRIEMKTRAEFDKAAAGSQAPPEPARRVP